MLQLDARDGVEDLVAGHARRVDPARLARAGAARRTTSPTQTRLRIPLLVAEDCIHGHSFCEGATIFPTQLGMAATWDPDLVERVARATAVEVAATGVHWTFSPVLCIARDLRWGRVERDLRRGPVPHRRAGVGDGARLPGRRPHRPDGDPGHAPSTSPATPRPRAAATPARPTSPGASCARGSCRRSSGSPARAAGPSCSATSPWTACRSRSTTGCSTTCCAASGATRARSSPTGTTSAAWSGSSRSSPTTRTRRRPRSAPATTW